VLGDVRQCLLNDSVDAGLELGVESAARRGARGQLEPARYVEVVDRAVAFEQRLQRGLETKLVERGRP
jgi:hypothetical protein